MLEFHAFCGFCLELQTEKMVQNFVPFFYWKSLKFMEEVRKVHLFKCKTMDNFVVHHRYTGCIKTSASLGFNGKLLRCMHF